jgi:hypothetical protein
LALANASRAAGGYTAGIACGTNACGWDELRKVAGAATRVK